MMVCLYGPPQDQSHLGLMSSLFIYFLKLHFIYLLLHWVITDVCQLSLVGVSRGLLFAVVRGFSCCRAWALRPSGFGSCNTRSQQLQHMGLVTLRHVESSHTRSQTHVSCIGRWVLDHWITRKIHPCLINLTIVTLCVVQSVSHVWVFLQPYGLQPARFPCPWNFPGKNTGVGFYFLLQGTFLAQEWNQCLLHWQADPLSQNQGSPSSLLNISIK